MNSILSKIRGFQPLTTTPAAQAVGYVESYERVAEEVPKEVEKLSKEAQNKLIDEIHESFLTEVDRLLADNKLQHSLESEQQGLIDKVARLQALGFTSTKEVQVAKAEITRIENLKRENAQKQELVEAIEYFSQKYPHYKFITEESVIKICKKYNLIYGEISRYVGTVPEKNLKEIEAFKIDKEDEACLRIDSSNRREYNLHGPDRRVTTYKRSYVAYMSSEQATLTTASFSLDGDSTSFSPITFEVAAPLSDLTLKEWKLKALL